MPEVVPFRLTQMMQVCWFKLGGHRSGAKGGGQVCAQGLRADAFTDAYTGDGDGDRGSSRRLGAEAWQTLRAELGARGMHRGWEQRWGADSWGQLFVGRGGGLWLHPSMHAATTARLASCCCCLQCPALPALPPVAGCPGSRWPAGLFGAACAGVLAMRCSTFLHVNLSTPRNPPPCPARPASPPPIKRVSQVALSLGWLQDPLSAACAGVLAMLQYVVM